MFTYKINKISFTYIYKTLIFYIKTVKVVFNMFCSRYTRFESLYKFLNRSLKYSEYIRLNRSYNRNFLESNFDRFETKKKKLKMTLLTVNSQIQ